MSPLKQTIFLQLVRRSNYSSTGQLRVVSAGIKRPTSRAADSILVKLDLSVPREAFDPITVAGIEVPLSDIERPVVLAMDANEDE